MTPHEQWLKELNDRVRGPQAMHVSVPRHVLERIAALLGDDADIQWVESTVRYARGDEGDGLIGDLSVFGERLLAIATLTNVQESRWAGSPDPDGPVLVRVLRRADLDRIEVPTADNGAWDNGPDAWGRATDGSWRSRTSIELTYRDGTKVELGRDSSEDLFRLLPSLRADLLA